MIFARDKFRCPLCGFERTLGERLATSQFDPDCVKTRFWLEGRGRIGKADFMLGSSSAVSPGGALSGRDPDAPFS
jgi:hypothetical protein